MRVLIIALCACLFFGWVLLNRPDHKFRITFEFDTANGPRSGSGVFAVFKGKDGRILPNVASIVLKGDAIYVDLGDSRNLVAILSLGNDGSSSSRMENLAQEAFSYGKAKVPFENIKNLTGIVALPSSLIPKLLSFRDIKDPSTAELINPEKLSSVFGADYRLRSVSLKALPVGFWPFDYGGFVGEPVTRGIESKLEWWTKPGRPAYVALQSAGYSPGSSYDPESLFVRK